MNRLLVISGGSKGIGRAMIERFAKGGFDCLTCARNDQDLRELKRHVERTYSVGFDFIVADVAKKEDVDSFVGYALASGRKIEVLINNAGYFVPGKITEEEEGVFEKMIASNLASAYHLTRGLVQNMVAARQGHIFNMCSVASLFAYPNGGSYSITKFGLLGFSKVLREELKQHGIRVTAVMPGATKTASWNGVDLPDDRFMSPEDVAEAVWGAYSLSTRSVVEELIIRPQLGDI